MDTLLYSYFGESLLFCVSFLHPFQRRRVFQVIPAGKVTVKARILGQIADFRPVFFPSYKTLPFMRRSTSANIRIMVAFPAAFGPRRP
jgi:hypothetical protein